MVKILVFGESGLVGSRFSHLNNDKFEFLSPTLDEVDLLDKNQIKRSISDFDGEVVVNFAAFTNVDGAEEEKDNKEGLVYKLNSLAPKIIAEACKKNGKFLVHISTDYIFDGEKDETSYTEEDRPNPVNWYGETKFFGEENIIEVGGEFVIVRISMPFSANYIQKMDVARFFLKTLRDGNEIKAIMDQKITPVFVDDIANALAKLITKRSRGVYHIVSTSSTTPFEFAKKIAKIFSLNESLVKTTTFADYSANVKAQRLKNSWLSCKKFVDEFEGGILHSVDESLDIFKYRVLAYEQS